MLLNVHGTFLGLRAGAPETEPNDRFSPFRVGLDHLALAAPSTDTLLELQRQLDIAGVPNNGVENDPLLGAAYVAFYDPDGIAWELYALPGAVVLKGYAHGRAAILLAPAARPAPGRR